MSLGELIDAFKKAHPDMDEHEFFAMITADPTIVTNDRGSFCGRYCTWIGNQYVDSKIKVGDAPELRSALATYDKNKSHLKPIKEVKDLDELIGLVKDLSDDFKPTRCISKGEQGLEKVYEDDEWTVYIPHTFEASRKIGGDTRWCTAASNGQERFDYYTSKGPLYVNVRKSDGAKFQFHFEAKQFMDKNDKQIKLNNLGQSKEIINFYLGVYPYYKLLLLYDYVSPKHGFSNDLVSVQKDNKYSFAYKNGDLIKKDLWFDWTQEPCEGWSCVMTKRNKNVYEGVLDSYDWNNYIDQFGNLLLSDGFCCCHSFQNGFALVEEEKKRGIINYITLKGDRLLKESNFSEGEGFTEYKRALVKNKTTKEWSMIDNYGNILASFHRIYWTHNFKNAIVNTKSKKYNIIDINGDICCDDWLDNINELLQYYIIQKGDYFNILDKNFRLMFPSWADKYWIIPNVGILCSFNGSKKLIQLGELACFDLVPNNNLICQ